MASAQDWASPRLQVLIAGSAKGISGRMGTHRAGPSERTVRATDAASKAWRVGSASSQVRE
ncbi:hypothetical protein ACWIGY_24080 [Streptomyces anulatus]